MPEAIELRSDLAEFTADELVMVNSLIAAGNLERLRYAQAVVPRSKHRHPGLVHTSNLVHGSLRDQVLRFQNLRGRDPICRATLIIRAPPRRVPAFRLSALDRAPPGRTHLSSTPHLQLQKPRPASL